MDSSIQFSFPDRRSALLAYDTLEELGYDPAYNDAGGMFSVYVQMEQDDLVSALEIAQCHGGQLVDKSRFNESQAYASAYDLQDIPIPAHIVNEDLIHQESAESPGEYLVREALGDDPMQGDAFSAEVRI